VRLTYYYRFPVGKGPTQKQLLSQAGFSDLSPTFGIKIQNRVWRQESGIRQIVSIRQMADGEYWRWAKLRGPATVVSVTETPREDPPPLKWHHDPELLTPTIPPSFPKPFSFLANCRMLGIDSDPIIPRTFRAIYWISVRLGSKDDRSTISNRIRSIIRSDPEWVEASSGAVDHFTTKPERFGLYALDVTRRGPENNQVIKTEVTLTYQFRDPEYSPRIVN
jgi:hypothetical protein